ncbi:acetyltransferase (GNAT) family domain-containing protein [Trichoderma breve]|uniref:Acetyltransferase (GNAT) family domain-containing protein n=1 Tax=Trichoderma breve TaxID=2034170 RepID=A0A9W9BDP6_9HYPO|nr:acetyltransferase (GNAT) family domain-containing protein [Trichoderma breve]KAJ4861383.1 acetyltransferase (GNAT) family domain-containing protein [Trichoderma breve]
MQKASDTTGMFPTEVLPVTNKGDLEKIVDIEERAFGAASPLLRLIYPISPSPSSAILRSSKLARHEHVWQSDPTAHYIKAVTYETSPDGATAERIIGAAVYNTYESSHTASKRNPWPHSSDEVPKGANAPLCLHYFGTLTKARLDFTNGEPHAFLENLAVDPNFQKRGVGTKLLEFMISDIAARYADKGLDNVGCWLDSSPSGLKMYQNLGWEEVGAKAFDLEPWGGAKGQVHKNVHMLKSISVSKS